MGYTWEQHQKYGYMMLVFQRFEEIKASLKSLKCTNHSKRVKLESDWDGDYFVNVYISKYCCREFAEQIAEIFRNEELFNKINIIDE